MTISPQAWGYLSLAVAVCSYVPYFAGIFVGRTKPHAFSWLIWTLLATIASYAQYVSGAGAGAWVTALTAAVCFVIFCLALSKGEKHITKSDKFALAAALLTIPVWLATHNPLYSVILVSLIDLLGFYPTFRKSWFKPKEENVFTYTLNAFQFAFSLAALEQVSWTTALYPAALVAMNSGFVAMALWRQRVLGLR